MATEAVRKALAGTYRIELRWGDKPWWICAGSRVVSKHASKSAAQVARRRRVGREMASLNTEA